MAVAAAAVLAAATVALLAPRGGALVATPTCAPHATYCPQYCGASYTPLIPALSPTATAQHRLVQSNVFIRHGSRTQDRALQCWPDDSSAWDCGVADLLTHAEAGGQFARVAHIFEDLKWDFQSPSFLDSPYAVELNGTCDVGQLLPIGYAQQRLNGRGLAAAYVGPNSTLKLFPSGRAGPGDVALFSDNFQRTIASGQTLFSSMLPPAALLPRPNSTQGTIKTRWYVVPDAQNPLLRNEHLCPRVKQVDDALKQSATYLQLSASTDVGGAVYNAFEAATRAQFAVRNGFDCVLVHACNAQPVPAGLTVATMSNITMAVTAQEAFKQNANGALYAKLSIGPLLGTVLERLRHSFLGTPPAADRAKPFYLYSGHDVTLYPLLAVLRPEGASEWPQYADLLALEVYETAGAGSYAVRAVYHGEAIPIRGCPNQGPDYLCSLATFVQAMAAFVPTREECMVQDAPVPVPTARSSTAKTTTPSTTTSATTTTTTTTGHPVVQPASCHERPGSGREVFVVLFALSLTAALLELGYIVFLHTHRLPSGHKNFGSARGQPQHSGQMLSELLLPGPEPDLAA